MVIRPPMKSVGCDAAEIGIGIQRNWLGGVATSSKGALRSRPCSIGSKGLCATDGRIRYSLNSVADASGNDWTTDNALTMEYDSTKVAAVVNEIDAMDHSGTRHVGSRKSTRLKS